MTKSTPVIIEHRSDLIAYKIAGREILQPLAEGQLNLFEPIEPNPVFDGRNSAPTCTMTPLKLSQLIASMQPSPKLLSWSQDDAKNTRAPYVIRTKAPNSEIDKICR